MPFEHQVADGKEIPRALGHLLAFNEKKPRVKPEVREWLSRERLGLRNFIFMMGKDQVFAAGMQVETFAQLQH